MNDFAKTGIYLGVAALITAWATMTGPKARSLEMFSDQGEAFFAEFNDPNLATELEVWVFDEEASEIKPFSVKKDESGVWTIPSHWFYPADAKTRMAQSAAMLVGLKKLRVVSDLKTDHAKFGVVNPREENLETSGRGMVVTFKNSGGSALAELIIGNELESKTDHYYVRLPDKKRTYVAKFDNQLSTKFADWIETDLLKASSWDIQKVVFDNYSVDEQRGAIVKGDKIVTMKDDSSKWTVEGIQETEEPNTEKLNEIGTTLSQIKIVGVRPKPEGLDAKLQANTLQAELLRREIQSHGYFLANDRKLVSNEGDLIFHTRKGVVYTLKFGEIARGEGDAITSGKSEPEVQPGEGGPEPLPGNNRYLMVTAEFDESLLDKPDQPRWAEEELQKRKDARDSMQKIIGAIDAYKLANENKLPESLAKLTEKPGEDQSPYLEELPKDPWEQDFVFTPGEDGETYVVRSYGADQQPDGEGTARDLRSDQFDKEDELVRLDSDWKAHDKKIEEGKEEAEKLAKRFGPWFYVISEELFQKLKPKRADLVKPKAEENKEGAPEGATPGNGK